MEFTRFFLVSCSGVAIDLIISISLNVGLGFPLIVSAFLGFLAAVVFNYLMHMSWTFEKKSSHLGFNRFLRQAFVSCLVLSVRLVFLFFISLLPIASGVEPIFLLLATGASFFANYLLTKFYVFGVR